jgi:lipoprotein NlpI
MLRGAISPTEAIRTAASIDPRKALQRLCEASFYAGQLYLIQGERDAAKAAFEAAVATGVVEYLEYDWALREMELLDSGR